MTWIVPAVVLVVLAFQFLLFMRSRTLAREDDTAAFDDLLARFVPDLIDRAKRGDAPDWLRYMDDADRVQEAKDEKLRLYATAALVVGIGGTMAALALHLWQLFLTDTDGQSLGSLLTAMGWALTASLLGVGNNLLISLWLLSQADKRFTTLLQRFKRQLYEASSAHPPQETFAEAVKSQLANAFREAVQKFPEAFERLDQHVESLASEIERQSTTVLSAATQLRESADRLAGAAAGMAPAADRLAASTDQLRGLPESIRTTLESSRDAWEQEIRSGQSAFVAGVREVLTEHQALLESTRSTFHDWEEKRSSEAEVAESRRRESDLLIRNATAEVVSTVNALPSTFATEVERVSNTLGRQFGLEARNHVQDLVQRITDENETLRTQIDRVATELQTRFLNSTSDVVSDVVSKTLQKVYQRVENTLLASLDEVGRGLREALTELPNNATSFAQSLADADERIKQALDGIKESSDHLAKVATLTEGLEASLTTALTRATVDGAEPLRQDVHEFVTDLHRTHDQLLQTHTQINGMVESLIEFIRNLVERLTHPTNTH